MCRALPFAATLGSHAPDTGVERNTFPMAGWPAFLPSPPGVLIPQINLRYLARTRAQEEINRFQKDETEGKRSLKDFLRFIKFPICINDDEYFMAETITKMIYSKAPFLHL